MIKREKIFIISWLIVFTLACNIGMATPLPADSGLLATLSASTPQTDFTPSYFPATLVPSVTSQFDFPTGAPTLTVPTSVTAETDPPLGKIVYTCQIYKVQASNQICMINADGTGFRRLTTDDNRQHYYASLAPDGKSVLYSAFREKNIYEIYEMNLDSGAIKQLTNKIGVANAPEVSPSGEFIVFMRWTIHSNRNLIYLMDRDGGNQGNIPRAEGWDPTWSPDGKYILFASNLDGGATQLYTIRTDGKELHKITNLPAIRGRSDWSPDGQFIVTYSGEAWKREVYILNADGTNARVLTPAGGNSQGPSISPDGKWVVFTAYFDHPNDEHGCEIYIIRTNGTDLRRLTNNDYCDYQPRWGS